MSNDPQAQNTPRQRRASRYQKINGFNVDTSGMASWTVPWLGPLSKMEAAGLGFVGLIALSVYLKMRKRG